MADSLEFKKICKTSWHVERAIRIVDESLQVVFKEPFRWSFREFETTGIQETKSRPFVSGLDLHDLAASVRITGQAGNVLVWSVEALVEFSGSEEPHDPSGNIIQRLKAKEVRIKWDMETYVFVEGRIPGDL